MTTHPGQKKILFLGGCRSGKSSQALKEAAVLGCGEKKFIATCQALDQEMEARIAKHRHERGDEWQTIEEPMDLPGVIKREDREGALLLVDCLTLWVNNLLMSGSEDADLIDREEVVLNCFQELETAIAGARGHLLFVSNEVGAGIVPEHPLSRQFRDLVGLLNQQVARSVDRVIWMVAGLPVEIKS